MRSVIQGFDEALAANLERGREEIDSQMVNEYKAKVLTIATTGYL